ncbi:addiction module protein [Variovorax soli]|uniref:addiction module protein n=1 Tax=Variovorax soli TaxID=376815 RepID=UPI000838E812|nr:addiction module protein [Variovorax soli]
MNALLKDIAELGVHEKLQLVEDLWDSIAEDAMPPMSNEVYEELCRRAAWADANPGQGQSLEQIAESLGVRL